MQWPNRSEYSDAVRDYPHVSLQDPKLKGGKPRRGKDSFLISDAGAFSIVFPIDVVSKTYALRCWTQDVRNAEVRYKQISDYLKRISLPYFVGFEYVLGGILVNGNKYPITRMEWSEGISLRQFIEQNSQSAHIFKVVADEFKKMVAALHDHQIAHGDLQDGNILLERSSTGVKIKLIDYDSLVVPALQNQPEQIVGLPQYQHPKRIVGDGQGNEKVDYFSELVIYLSFLSLSENPALWTQFGDEKRVDRGLLFSKEDFENPNRSPVFRELAKLSPNVQQLAATLKDFCDKTSIDQLAPLETVLPKQDANAYSDQGDSFRKDGQYNEALAEYQKAIDLKPDYARAYFGRGHVYRHIKQYANAVIAFQQAIKLKPNYKEAYHGLGITYFESGGNNRAEAAANAALKIDPHYLPTRQLLDAIKSATSTSIPSSSAKSKPRPKQSATKPTSRHTTSQSAPTHSLPDVMKRTIEILRNHWQFAAMATMGFALGICFIFFLTQMSAKDQLEKQSAQQASEIQILNSLVQDLENDKKKLNHENDRLREDLEDLREALNTRDRNVTDQSQQLSETETELASWMNKYRKSESQLNHKNAEIQQLQEEKAVVINENRSFQVQLAEKTSEAKNLTDRAQQLRSEKIKTQRQNQKLQGENADLIHQNRNLRNENEALRNKLDKAKKGNPKGIVSPEPPMESRDYRNFVNRAVSRNNQGCVAFKDSEYDKAVKQFRQAIKTESKFVEAHYNLGCTFLEMEEYRKAISAFNKAVALNQKFKEAYYNRSLVYFRTNQLQKAKQDATKALNIDDNYRIARELLTAIENVQP